MILQATRAIINTGIYAKNIELIKSHTGNKKLINVVKADAYGHGLVPMSMLAQKNGVDYLAIATVSEGVLLREAGITMPIILLFPHTVSEAEYVIHYNIIPVLSDNEMIIHYEKYLKKYNKKLNAHIKVDTGLGRMGVVPDDLLSFSKKILSSGLINITGLTTHLASAGVDDEKASKYLASQIAAYNKALNILEKENIKIELKHIAASGAILYNKEAHFDAIRFGLISYGYSPDYKRNNLNLTPIMDVMSKVVLIKNIKKGSSVSYGMTWTAKNDSKVAIIPIGYTDGLHQELSNKGKVKIKGNYYPIVGRVCMDCTIIDITEARDIELEDDVLIYGNDPILNASTLAQMAGTIPYIILTSLSARVRREYI